MVDHGRGRQDRNRAYRRHAVRAARDRCRRRCVRPERGGKGDQNFRCTCEVRLKEGSGAKSAGAFLNLSKNHKITSTNIAKKLLLQRCSKPLLIPIFNFSHKRPTFAFTPESGYTLAFQRKIAHKGTHAETGVFWMGVVSLLSERSARSPTSPGRVSERQVLPLLGLGRGCSQRTQRAFGTAMRLCASLSRGVAAPLGCVIFFASVEIATCTPCAQGLSVCARRGVVSLPSARFTCC